MVEHTQVAREGEIEIMHSVAVGENVLQIGEDVKEGEEVIPGGTLLRPAEIGGLMALGITEIVVSIKPKVGIISSGDEVIPPEEEMKHGQVRDVNTYTLSALVEESGGTPVPYGIVSDELTAMQGAAAQALQECDFVVITAGSSASTRDLTSQVIEYLGKPGVLVHGVNIRPGKPTILGVCDGKPVVGLPGNPVSALVIAGLFVVPVIELFLGLSTSRPQPRIPAKLAVNLSSQAGREEWVSVRLIRSQSGFTAEPIFGKSNLIFTLSKGDGLIKIPADATGLSAGEIIDVWLM
jgi:molybdopterin molybdotransferase